MPLTDDVIDQAALSEVLDLTVEECGEVVVARSKLRRFGADSCNPADPDGPDNWQAMKIELLDVFALVRALIRRGIITHGEAERHVETKLTSVLRLHPHLASIL